MKLLPSLKRNPTRSNYANMKKKGKINKRCQLFLNTGFFFPSGSVANKLAEGPLPTSAKQDSLPSDLIMGTHLIMGCNTGEHPGPGCRGNCLLISAGSLLLRPFELGMGGGRKLDFPVRGVPDGVSR